MLVEIIEFDPAAGQEYLHTGYPGPGLYYVRRLQSLVLVQDTTTNWFVVHELFLRGTCSPKFKPEPVQFVPDAPSITSDLLLKAIAIAQHPALAKDLL